MSSITSNYFVMDSQLILDTNCFLILPYAIGWTNIRLQWIQCYVQAMWHLRKNSFHSKKNVTSVKQIYLYFKLIWFVYSSSVDCCYREITIFCNPSEIFCVYRCKNWNWINYLNSISRCRHLPVLSRNQKSVWNHTTSEGVVTSLFVYKFLASLPRLKRNDKITK